ncbi:hypothetical protein PGTUg99_013717 [Puccinia graminis f. sp. tritici]|uniref:Uncharacterized protein n=1 Tax=Puccinia graminis f. sp. tritici TaxID=56615 RepID=A0A5B0R5M6_PUCGR|nr:hypothetical protein PGTUg99_013717 [Puccinia graminis f. sp. tritici]
MANHLEPSSSSAPQKTHEPSNSSALHHLIRRFTRIPTTLKTLALADTHNHHQPSQSIMSATHQNSPNYKLTLNKNHPLRKVIPSLFLSDPSIDPHPGTSQLSEAESMMSNDSCRKRRMDNLVLAGFLKNNGGYLDDSGSSSASSDLDDTNDQTISSDEDEQDQEHHIHNLNILAKKHQPADTPDGTKTSMAHKTNLYPHQSSTTSNLSKRLLHLHLSNKSDHRKSATVVLNKPIDHQTYTTIDPPDDRHFPKSTKDTYDDNYTNINHIEDRPAQGGRFDRLTNNTHPKRPASSKSQSREDNAHPEGGRCRHIYKQRWYATTGARKPKETGGQEDEEAGLSFNLKYLRSSTFPTKNSILDSQVHTALLHSSPRTLPTRSSSPTITPVDQELRHRHPDFDEFKSPFRNLILGQDDLLRSN